MENQQSQHQQQQPEGKIEAKSAKKNLFGEVDSEQLNKDLEAMEAQAKKEFEARYQIIGEIKRDPVEPSGQPKTPRKIRPQNEWKCVALAGKQVSYVNDLTHLMARPCQRARHALAIEYLIRLPGELADRGLRIIFRPTACSG